MPRRLDGPWTALALLAVLLAGCSEGSAPAPAAAEPPPSTSTLLVEEHEFSVSTSSCLVTGSQGTCNILAAEVLEFPVEGRLERFELNATWDATNPNEKQLRFRILDSDYQEEWDETASSPARLDHGDLEYEQGSIGVWIGVDYAVAGGFAGTGTVVTGVVRLTQNVTSDEPADSRIVRDW